MTAYVDADCNNPELIISEAGDVLNFNEPVAAMFMGVLGYVADFDVMRSIVARTMAPLPSGNYLVLWDGTATGQAVVEGGEKLVEAGAVIYYLRTPDELGQCFEGLEMVDPGLVQITHWRPDTLEVEPIDAYGAVARKPGGAEDVAGSKMVSSGLERAGDMSSAELHVSGRPYTTAGWITQTLEAMEYAYNLAAVIEIAEQGALRDMSEALALLQGSSGSGLDALNMALRLSIPENAQLHVSLIQATGSFNIKFSGLGSVIKALASVFDPIARAKRREGLRHTEVMNRLAEDDEMTKVASNRLDLLVRTLDDPRSSFNLRAREGLGEEGHGELKQLLVREYGRAVALLGGNRIRVISQPEPDQARSLRVSNEGFTLGLSR